MSDAIPMRRKIQNRLIVSALPPKKVMLSMNVLTDRIRVIIPGISITLPLRFGSAACGVCDGMFGMNFQSKKKNKMANGVAEKNTNCQPPKYTTTAPKTNPIALPA